jgi:hypothetical protein
MCRVLLTMATCGFALQTCFTDPGMLPRLSPSEQFQRNMLPRYALKARMCVWGLCLEVLDHCHINHALDCLDHAVSVE